MERDISTAGVQLLIEQTAHLMMADNDGQMRTIFGFPRICQNIYNASGDEIYCNYLCKFWTVTKAGAHPRGGGGGGARLQPQHHIKI